MNVLMQALDTQATTKIVIADRGNAKQAKSNQGDDFKQSLERVRQESNPGRQDSTSDAEESRPNEVAASDVKSSEQTKETSKSQDTSDDQVEAVDSKDQAEEPVDGETVDQSDDEVAVEDYLLVQIDAQIVEKPKSVEQDSNNKLSVQDLQNIVKDVFDAESVDVQVNIETEEVVAQVTAEPIEQQLVESVDEQNQVVANQVDVKTEEIVQQGVVVDQKQVKANEVTQDQSVNVEQTAKSEATQEVGAMQNVSTDAQMMQKDTNGEVVSRDGESIIANKAERETQPEPEIKVDTQNVKAVAVEPVTEKIETKTHESTSTAQIRLDPYVVNNDKSAPQIQLPNTGADNEQQNVARIERGLQSALNQNGGKVTLRLTPAELGTVRIQLQIQGTQVNVQMHTEQESAKSMLNQHLQHLRQSLEHQGLSVERIGVQSMQNTSQSNMNSQSDMNHSDGRSRGEYSDNQQQNDNQDSQQSKQETFQDFFGEEVAA